MNKENFLKEDLDNKELFIIIKIKQTIFKNEISYQNLLKRHMKLLIKSKNRDLLTKLTEDIIT